MIYFRAPWPCLWEPHVKLGMGIPPFSSIHKSFQNRTNNAMGNALFMSCMSGMVTTVNGIIYGFKVERIGRRSSPWPTPVHLGVLAVKLVHTVFCTFIIYSFNKFSSSCFQITWTTFWKKIFRETPRLGTCVKSVDIKFIQWKFNLLKANFCYNTSNYRITLNNSTTQLLKSP